MAKLKYPHHCRGQSMTEYVILTAMAILVLATPIPGIGESVAELLYGSVQIYIDSFWTMFRAPIP